MNSFSFSEKLDKYCHELILAIENINRFIRYIHPSEIGILQNKFLPYSKHFIKKYNEFKNIEVPDTHREIVEIINKSSDFIVEAIDGINSADPGNFQQFINVFLKSFRKKCNAQELLYPLHLKLTRIDSLFLESGVIGLNNQSNPELPKPNTGLIHSNIDKDPYERGAYSLYVPESYDETKEMPLIVALHGGFGHGRYFIWTWLKEARSRHFALLSPTSKGRTWSIANPEEDCISLRRMIDLVTNSYNIDRSRILLTGMSDGATFAIACAVLENVPFTAYAPISGTIPIMDLGNIKNKRIKWTHGRHDWMFPIYRVEREASLLKTAVADIEFTIIEDLSHTYPREANDSILKWFDPGLAILN